MNDDNDDRSSGAIVKEHAAGWVDGWEGSHVPPPLNGTFGSNVAPRGKIVRVRICGGKPTVSMADVL